MTKKKLSRKLENEYRIMSQDKERESQALEWVEAALLEPVDDFQPSTSELPARPANIQKK